MPTLLNDTFRAWIDHMPGSGPRLIVIGEMQVPTTGWHVRLTRRSPQGFNPKILILDVSAEKPHGMAGQMVTTIPLRYEEHPPQHDYTQVTIANGGDSVTIGVGHTH